MLRALLLTLSLGIAHGAADPACESSAGHFHHAHLGVCTCECFLIDVGANNGSSVDGWPMEALYDGAMKGSLEALQAVPSRHARFKECVASPNRCYYGFEANPAFDASLHKLQAARRAVGVHMHIFRSTAFNIGDADADFLVEPEKTINGVRTDDDPNTARAFGSTLEGMKGYIFQDAHGVWRKNKKENVSERYRHTTVRSVDAAGFLATLAASSSKFVGMKMDVEGFEYRLLGHLLLTTPRALCALDVLAIEWHEHMMTYGQHEGASTHLAWMMAHPMCNVTLLPWG